MVNAYFDSGVLTKNYVAEVNSGEAQDLLGAEKLPLPLTHLQELEVRNGIRLKAFRREITDGEVRIALSMLDDDIRAGRLESLGYSLPAVFRRAQQLSAFYATATGARSLDILHVAAALELGCKRFVSLDQRQRKVAANAGLRVVPR